MGEEGKGGRERKRESVCGFVVCCLCWGGVLSVMVDDEWWNHRAVYGCGACGQSLLRFPYSGRACYATLLLAYDSGSQWRAILRWICATHTCQSIRWFLLFCDYDITYCAAEPRCVFYVLLRTSNDTNAINAVFF
ncbi:hypothetical protein VNO77_32546 [Canavalia gladiata]|uniref:Uncharacterized protein n=1 Tax=Canavalia gladiata TaxID=3824 RepID=A0AAN9KSR4_CANGL